MHALRGASPRNLVLGLSAILFTSWCHQAKAQFSMFSESIVGGNNDGFIGSFDFSYVTDNSVASASATKSFIGLDGSGNMQTMTFTGNTVSQSDYGRLHVLTSGSLTNSYYNAGNTPYFDHDGNLFDLNGSPSTLASLGFAVFNDTLQYGGALQSGYRARYIFHVDGTNSGTGALADLAVNVDSNPGEGFFDFEPGFFAANWVTQDYAVNGVTPQHINVQFSTQVVFDTFNLTDGQNYAGSSDFSSTLTLAGIELVDANGNLASGWTVTSASGTQYNAIQGVPEPGNVVLLGSVLFTGAGLFLRRRRGEGAYQESTLCEPQ